MGQPCATALRRGGEGQGREDRLPGSGLQGQGPGWFWQLCPPSQGTCQALDCSTLLAEPHELAVQLERVRLVAGLRRQNRSQGWERPSEAHTAAAAECAWAPAGHGGGAGGAGRTWQIFTRWKYSRSAPSPAPHTWHAGSPGVGGPQERLAMPPPRGDTMVRERWAGKRRSEMPRVRLMARSRPLPAGCVDARDARPGRCRGARGGVPCATRGHWSHVLERD